MGRLLIDSTLGLIAILVGLGLAIWGVAHALKRVGFRGSSPEALKLYTKGIRSHNTGRRREALDCLQQALTIYRDGNDRIGEGKTLSGIGVVYWALGRYDQALQNYQQALEIRREIGDRTGEGTTLSNIGVVYRVLAACRRDTFPPI